MKKEMICIVCPMGCHLTVTQENDEIEVTGNTCPKGKQYAINELTNPTRTLTTTVEIAHAIHHQLPVITSHPIPLDKIQDVMKFLKGKKVEAPVHENDIIVKDVLGLGVDIIASRDMEVKNQE